jgi:type IV pilus assembly protein PilA
VILVIGILAAIALPSFLDQRHKAEDANAKSNVRNMLSQMEVCYTERDGYVGCQAALDTVRTGLPIGGGPGQVEVETEAYDSYSVIAHSRSGNWFRISNGPTGITHECGVADVGACPSTGTW